MKTKRYEESRDVKRVEMSRQKKGEGSRDAMKSRVEESREVKK